uniref:Uncharacterized protein n=1 Tax=Triticum urartu TaxID=4572 RepID=A0A8R7TYD4_TRIUA
GANRDRAWRGKYLSFPSPRRFPTHVIPLSLFSFLSSNPRLFPAAPPPPLSPQIHCVPPPVPVPSSSPVPSSTSSSLISPDFLDLNLGSTREGVPERWQRQIPPSRGAGPPVRATMTPAWRLGHGQPPRCRVRRRGLWGPRSKGLARLLIVGSGDAKPKI